MIQPKYRKDIAKPLGPYLRSHRKRMGWAQTRAGDAVGLDAVTVRPWESWSFSPSSKRTGRVAEVHGVDVSSSLDVAETTGHDGPNTLLSIKGFWKTGPLRAIRRCFVNGRPAVADGPRQPTRLPLDRYRRFACPGGIRDGDTLLTCPARPPRFGGLCVADRLGFLYVGAYVTPDHIRVRTNAGTTVDFGLDHLRLVGTVSWHVRKT